MDPSKLKVVTPIKSQNLLDKSRTHCLKYRLISHEENVWNKASILFFSRSVMSNSLQPHGLQHTRLSCPSSSSRACTKSCPLSQWCHPTILSSVTPFSFCPQSLSASGSFPMNWLYASDGQSIGASASALVFPNEYSGLISFRIV